MKKPKTLTEVRAERRHMQGLYNKYKDTPQIKLWDSMHKKQQQMMTYVVELRDSILLELEAKDAQARSSDS